MIYDSPPGVVANQLVLKQVVYGIHCVQGQRQTTDYTIRLEK